MKKLIVFVSIGLSGCAASISDRLSEGARLYCERGELEQAALERVASIKASPHVVQVRCSVQ